MSDVRFLTFVAVLTAMSLVVSGVAWFLWGRKGSRWYEGRKQTGPGNPISDPPHYQANGIQAKDVIRAFGLNFAMGNVVKYILRADRKGAPVEDLKKARAYLDDEIAAREVK